MSLIDDLALKGPKNPQDRVVLMAMAALANQERVVATTPRALANHSGVNEPTVKLCLSRLTERLWLRALEPNVWEVCSPTRTGTRLNLRARDTPAPGFINKKQTNEITTHSLGSKPLSVNTENYSNQHTKRNSNEGFKAEDLKRPKPTKDCPHCGGTGWMEVDPVANGNPPGYYTVDYCSCVGGPEPRATSVYPKPQRPTMKLPPDQIMRNLQGVDEARKKLRDEEA